MLFTTSVYHYTAARTRLSVMDNLTLIVRRDPMNVAQCPECVLIPGQSYYCPDCHLIVKATNSGVYEQHDITYAWDNQRIEWRKYKVSPGTCKASGTNFVWLDYHECSEWWPSYEGVVI